MPLSLSYREIASVELFHDLHREALDEVLVRARCRVLARGVRIFDQGDGPVRAHALIEGSVRIVQSGDSGEQIVVRFIGRGEIFGAVALFTDRRYPADAETLTDTIEVSWSETALSDLLARYPGIAMNALKIVGSRLQEAQNRLRELSRQPVERRVAHTLLRLSHQTGRMTEAGLMIDIPLRRKDIADVCGTTLHSASRILTRWEKHGLLTTQDQRLIVLKLQDIRNIADSTG